MPKALWYVGLVSLSICLCVLIAPEEAEGQVVAKNAMKQPNQNQGNQAQMQCPPQQQMNQFALLLQHILNLEQLVLQMNKCGQQVGGGQQKGGQQKGGQQKGGQQVVGQQIGGLQKGGQQVGGMQIGGLQKGGQGQGKGQGKGKG